MKQFVISSGGELRGELRVASDKSISHRAILLASLAKGRSEISNLLLGEDVRSTLQVMRDCGIEASEERGRLAVCGGQITSPNKPLDCGNSGTLMRLFCGIAAGWQLNTTLVGDSSLLRRPMLRVTDPLVRMGAKISTAEGGVPPIVTTGGVLQGAEHHLSIASAQIKSAILLAGLRAEGATSVTEKLATRDHTERMLEVFDVSVQRDGLTATVQGGAELSPARFGIPADISSAAFFMVGAAISGNSEIVLKDVGINPTRTGIIELLRRMGARINILNQRNIGAEPAADIHITGGGLRGINIGADEVPSAIDEFPAIMIAAAAAQGDTIISGATELRHKESDRISSMVTALRVLGVDCEETEDGAIIEGRGEKDAAFNGGQVESNGDHRIAMALAMAGLRAKKEIVINNCDNVETSFPNFHKQAAAAGLRIACGHVEVT